MQRLLSYQPRIIVLLKGITDIFNKNIEEDADFKMLRAKEEALKMAATDISRLTEDNKKETLLKIKEAFSLLRDVMKKKEKEGPPIDSAIIKLMQDTGLYIARCFTLECMCAASPTNELLEVEKNKNYNELEKIISAAELHLEDELEKMKSANRAV